MKRIFMAMLVLLNGCMMTEPGKDNGRQTPQVAVPAKQAAITNGTVIKLWPGVAPGSEDWNYAESVEVANVNGVPRRQVHNVRNVSNPTMLAYLADPAKANGTAVIVCPGGAMVFLGVDYEGTELAEYLNTIGVSAFVLKYRIQHTVAGKSVDAKGNPLAPGTPNPMFGGPLPEMAKADAEQAMRIIRSHAKAWKINPDRIGAAGFSAGGIPAFLLALDKDPVLRANFMVGVYPVPYGQIDPKSVGAGPLFITQAQDDRIIRTSPRVVDARTQAKIPVEYKIYPSGGHGFGMIKHGIETDTWPDHLRDWMDSLGLLKPGKGGPAAKGDPK